MSVAITTPSEVAIPRERRPLDTAFRAYSIWRSFPVREKVVREKEYAESPWGRKGGRYLMNKRWEGLVNCEKLPELAVTAVAVNNNGNEVAVGCANGNVRVYDLSR